MSFKQKLGVFFNTIELTIISVVLIATAFGIYFLGVRTGYVAAEKKIAEGESVSVARYPIERQAEDLDPTKSTAVYSRLTDKTKIEPDASPSQIPVGVIQNQADVPVVLPDMPKIAKSLNEKPLSGWYVTSTEILTAEEGDLLVERLRGLGFIALLSQPTPDAYSIMVGPESTEVLASRLLEQLKSENALIGDLVVKNIK